MTHAMTEARSLPLHHQHAKRGAKFIEFAGWQVPLSYSGIRDEHEAVRRHAGLFDVSHMGKFRIRGVEAYGFLERVLSNGLRKIGPGRALYSWILNERGGAIDDVIVYQIDRSHFFMIVNAATREKDFRWLESQRERGVELADESDEKIILAVQGPESGKVIEKLWGREAASIPPFHFLAKHAGGGEIFLAATGYTGERGFEIVAGKEEAAGLFDGLLEAGVRPAGFGARDTLRLEAGLLLYGQDMDENVSPLEAGLSWVCDFGKEFMGRRALIAEKENGLKKRLAAFELTETGIARHGHDVCREGQKIGTVTSGTYAPTLEKSIGLAYVPPPQAEAGSEFSIRIREKEVRARAVRLPFYKAA